MKKIELNVAQKIQTKPKTEKPHKNKRGNTLATELETKLSNRVGGMRIYPSG